MLRTSLALLALGTTLVGTAANAQTPKYKMLHTIPVGSEGGWDYVLADAGSRKLFVSHGNHVVVIDMDTEKIAGDIADTPGVHGIAVSKSGKGFISDGRANRVDMFDVKTLAKTGSVPAGTNPDAITYDPASDHVFAFNGGSKDATAINAATGKVDATIPLGGKPEAGVPDGMGHVYVNVEDTNEIVEIDTKALKTLRRFKVTGCEGPSGLAIDQKNHRLFAGCGDTNTMGIVDPRSGKTLIALPIGKGVDACDFDPGTGIAYASTGDGHLTLIKETSPDKFEVVQTVDTSRSARTMSLDSKNHRAYMPSAKYGPAPAPVAGAPRTRPAMIAGSFEIDVVGQE